MPDKGSAASAPDFSTVASGPGRSRARGPGAGGAGERSARQSHRHGAVGAVPGRGPAQPGLRRRRRCGLHRPGAGDGDPGVAPRDGRAAVRPPGRRDGGGLRGRQADRGGLPALVDPAPRGASRQVRASAGRAGDRQCDGDLGWGRLAGARGLRSVRRHLPGTPRPAPDPDAGELRRRAIRSGRTSRCVAASRAPSRRAGR